MPGKRDYCCQLSCRSAVLVEGAFDHWLSDFINGRGCTPWYFLVIKLKTYMFG